MKFFFTLLFTFFTLLTLPMTTAKYLDGEINSAKDFVFLSRFVFQPNEYGEMVYTFAYPTTECCYQMLIFNDEPGQWPYMREHEDELDCFEKKALIPGHYNGKVTLSTTQNCDIRTNNQTQEEEFYCHGKRHFDVIEERWWYIAIAHCGEDGIKNFKYNIHLTNGRTAFDKEFSADERYILQTDIGFLGVYVIICACLRGYRKLMIHRRMLNAIYRLFCFSVYLQTISLLIQTTSLASGRLRPVTALKIAVFGCFYFFAYFGLYTVKELIYDPRDVINKYDSFAAFGVIIMQFIGLIWMYYASFFTLKHNRSKAIFYIPFIIISTMWFVGTPVTILMSNEFLAKWKRAKIVNGLELVTLFYGHVIFLILTRPDGTNKFFPFHLTTNMVDILNTDEEECRSEPPMYHSLFGATAAKYVVESECQETIDNDFSPVVPINFDITSNEVESSSPSDTVALSIPAAEEEILPKGRFILVEAFVEEEEI